MSADLFHVCALYGTNETERLTRVLARFESVAGSRPAIDETPEAERDKYPPYLLWLTYDGDNPAAISAEGVPHYIDLAFFAAEGLPLILQIRPAPKDHGKPSALSLDFDPLPPLPKQTGDRLRYHVAVNYQVKGDKKESAAILDRLKSSGIESPTTTATDSGLFVFLTYPKIKTAQAPHESQVESYEVSRLARLALMASGGADVHLNIRPTPNPPEVH